MLFNALSTVALLLTTITGADALRSDRHHRGLEHRHVAHVPADKRTFTFSANATAGAQIGKRRIESGLEGLDPSNSTHSLGKRAYDNMRATFYAIGLGACGQYNSEPDFIVALNSAQYGGGYPGPECFKYITITGGPKNGHAVARIMDECPTCPYGGLDMSIALFEQFATQDDGVASVTWWYNDEAPAPAPTTSETPTSTWVAPTTSTTPAWTPPASTSTWQAPSPSTSSTPSSVWQAPTTSSSVWVAPTTSSTSTWQAPSSSSTWSSSSSVWTSSSSSAPASSSSAISTGRAISASVTDLVKVSTRVSTASGSISTAAPTTTSLSDGSDSDEDSNPDAAAVASNLDMLSTYTAQLGSLVVVAAQMVIQ